MAVSSQERRARLSAHKRRSLRQWGLRWVPFLGELAGRASRRCAV